MKLRNVFPIIAIALVAVMAGCKKTDDPGVRPVVTSTDPISSAINISVSSKISAAFSTAMDPATITSSTFT